MKAKEKCLYRSCEKNAQDTKRGVKKVVDAGNGTRDDALSLIVPVLTLSLVDINKWVTTYLTASLFTP
jgi:hypothetical protein